MYYYTLSQARQALTGATGAYASTDLTADINKAVYALSGLSGWECLRRTVRLASVGPVFALPQGYEGLVRVCINGKPAMLRTQDFRYLQSGPGDLRRPPRGFAPCPLKNIVDAGLSPVIYEPQRAFRVFAFTDSPVEVNEPELVVTGRLCDGRSVQTSLPLHHLPVYDSAGELVPGTAEPSEVSSAPFEFVQLDEVVVPDGMSGYTILYAEDVEGGARYQIALYNPRVSVPKFRRYEISDVPPGKPLEILAETRIAFTPLVKDTDVLPFPALEPVEWMIRADWAMRSGEPTQAQNYRTQAMNWLKAQEVADDTVQTQVVVNSVYAGSMGEISEEADNI